MDKTYPLVTIITPCLNMESFIARTIESVLSQDYPNVEYILLDGGSTDRTAEVIREFVAKNPGRSATYCRRSDPRDEATH